MDIQEFLSLAYAYAPAIIAIAKTVCIAVQLVLFRHFAIAIRGVKISNKKPPGGGFGICEP